MPTGNFWDRSYQRCLFDPECVSRTAYCPYRRKSFQMNSIVHRQKFLGRHSRGTPCESSCGNERALRAKRSIQGAASCHASSSTASRLLFQDSRSSCSGLSSACFRRSLRSRHNCTDISTDSRILPSPRIPRRSAARIDAPKYSGNFCGLAFSLRDSLRGNGCGFQMRNLRRLHGERKLESDRC